MPPARVQEKAWLAESGAVVLWPTTWPLGLTDSARLESPPRVPRSTIPPVRVQEKACIGTERPAPGTGAPSPTTWPPGLAEAAPPEVPAPGVPVATAPPARAAAA